MEQKKCAETREFHAFPTELSGQLRKLVRMLEREIFKL